SELVDVEKVADRHVEEAGASSGGAARFSRIGEFIPLIVTPPPAAQAHQSQRSTSTVADPRAQELQHREEDEKAGIITTPHQDELQLLLEQRAKAVQFVKALVPVYNRLIDGISCDVATLQAELSAASEVDPFTRQLLGIAHRVYGGGTGTEDGVHHAGTASKGASKVDHERIKDPRKEPRLHLMRHDYLFQRQEEKMEKSLGGAAQAGGVLTGDSSSVNQNHHLQCKLVEINTIAVAFAGMAQDLLEIHKEGRALLQLRSGADKENDVEPPTAEVAARATKTSVQQQSDEAPAVTASLSHPAGSADAYAAGIAAAHRAFLAKWQVVVDHADGHTDEQRDDTKNNHSPRGGEIVTKSSTSTRASSGSAAKNIYQPDDYHICFFCFPSDHLDHDQQRVQRSLRERENLKSFAAVMHEGCVVTVVEQEKEEVPPEANIKKSDPDPVTRRNKKRFLHIKTGTLTTGPTTTPRDYKSSTDVDVEKVERTTVDEVPGGGSTIG
ncbi:unnamed protein product, partial [Amoebophrya sp. A120]